MNFLVITNDYTGNIVYKRLIDEGHNVWICNPYARANGIPFIKTIYNCLTNHIDCAIICNVGFTKEGNILRLKNIPTIGGTHFHDLIELNKEKQKQLCKEYKVRYLKPTTKVSYPLSTEIWFSNGEPLYQYFNYIKQFKFLTGDMGPDVDGESVIFWSNLDRNVESVKRIFEDGLFGFLKSIKYTGPFAIDACVSEDDNYPYVSNIIPRTQAVVLSAMLELYDDNFGNYLVHLVQNDHQSILLRNQISISVAISQPPYPYGNSGLVKYEVASGNDWLQARKNLALKIKELDIPNIQYRIDGGQQGAYIECMRKDGYFNN